MKGDKIYYDKNGREIFRGVLLKTYHFTGARKKKFYLYHVVVESDYGYLEMIPYSWLDPKNNRSGGRCTLAAINTKKDCEIISGFDSNGVSYEDRPKGQI